MLPLANKPMMEHIVELLKRHGFDEIVVTVAFMANHIRTYFGDGSEFGVRMVYATEEQPLGTAGSVRNAMDVLDERFLVISGDVLTDIDLGRVVDFHDEHEALATIGLVRGREPARVRDRHHPRRRLDRAVPREAHVGPGVQRHHQHRHLRARARDLRLHRRGPAGRLLQRGVPGLLGAGKPLFGAVAEGYWEDVGTLEAYVSAHKDVLDGKVQVDIPGFELSDGVWLGEGAEVHPEATDRGPAVIGENCRVEAGARLGEYTVLGANVRVRARPTSSGSSSTTTPTSARASGLRRHGRGPGLRPAAQRALRGGRRCSATSASSARRRDRRGREGVPVQDGRGRRRRQLVDRVGVGGPAACSAATGWPASPTSTSPPSWPPRWRWPGPRTLKKGATVITSRDSSRSARMLKRAMMAGLNAGGDQRARPRGGLGAGHPVPGAPARSRAASPCGWSRATRSRW